MKDPEQGQFKVVRENSGYGVQLTLPIYLPFSKFFKDPWSHALGGSPLFQINLSLCPSIWNSQIILFAKFLHFSMAILEAKNSFKKYKTFLHL